MKVEVNAYYMIETDSACFGGYESYEEAQKFARLEKKQHPNDSVKIIHETTITTELGEVLIEIPPVQPERPKGKWIECKNQYNELWYKCSECGEEALSHEGLAIDTDFCPNCGAEMEGNNNGE